jgi:hypothetical protein
MLHTGDETQTAPLVEEPMAAAEEAPTPVVTDPAPRRSVADRLADPISGGMAAAMALAFLGAVWVSLAVQPPAPEPLPEPSAWDLLISGGLLMALSVAAIGLIARQRFGVLATFGGGIVLLAAAVSCMWSGHSGTWLVTQLVMAVGLTAAAGAAVKST